MATYPSVIAKVTSGWTGVITLTNAGTGVSALVTPLQRSSPLEVALSLVHAARRVHGVEFFIYVDDATKFVAVMPGVTFNLSSTGNAGTRMGLTSPVTGAAGSHTFASVIPDALAPDFGAQVRFPLVGKAKGRSMLSGSAGFTKGDGKNAGSVFLYGSSFSDGASASAALAAGGVYDHAIMRTNDATNVTNVSRFIIRSVGTQRWGKLGSRGRLRLTIQQVSE